MDPCPPCQGQAQLKRLEAKQERYVVGALGCQSLALRDRREPDSSPSLTWGIASVYPSALERQLFFYRNLIEKWLKAGLPGLT